MDTKTMTRQEARDLLHRETKAQARERNIPYAQAREHVFGANRELKEYAFGGVDRREPTQREGASGHLSEMIRMYHLKRGYSHRAAIAKALDEEPAGLRARRAGFPPPTINDRLSQDAREQSNRMAMFYGKETVADGCLRSYAAGSGPDETTHEDRLKTPADLVAARLAADCLYRGLAAPNQRHRSWADSWYGENVPPPAPAAQRDTTSDYNRRRQEFVEQAMERAREILRDPGAANELRPMPLGN